VIALHKASVLIVDDDEDLQAIMRQHLELQLYNITSALNAAEFIKKIGIQQPDIILLDLGLPDQDGLALLNTIRSKSRIPIIVISGRSEATDRIVGLEMGADDYLIKPFEMRELSARIKAMLRRGNVMDDLGEKETKDTSAKTKNLFFNGWILDRTQYQLFDKNGNTSGLTTGEFKLLEALLVASNSVLSREQLFEITRVGKFDVYDRVIDTQIARIRKKIGDDPQNPSLLKTIRGVGYMFCGDIKSKGSANIWK
jgi:DNA-binding response OmpR family regulator